MNAELYNYPIFKNEFAFGGRVAFNILTKIVDAMQKECLFLH